MRYYILTTAAGDEVARVGQGNATYLDSTTGLWVPDPLLALEVQTSEDWREVAPHELPSTLAHLVDGDQPKQKSRLFRRGRHSRA